MGHVDHFVDSGGQEDVFRKRGVDLGHRGTTWRLLLYLVQNAVFLLPLLSAIKCRL